MRARIERTHQGVALSIQIEESVFRPGQITFELCDRISVPPGARVADIGCGSGYCGIFAALLGAGEVVCIDPDPEAIALTISNCSHNQLENVRAVQGEALGPVRGTTFDLIISNPPQTPFPAEAPLARSGGFDGTAVIEQIIRDAEAALSDNGNIYITHAGFANPGRIRELFFELDLQPEIIFEEYRELVEGSSERSAQEVSEHILELAKQGRAELHRGPSGYFYPFRIYRIGRREPG